MSIKLSIITVNYNNNEGLKRTIESVKAQSFTSYEHIIIDADSTDGSKQTIEEYVKGNPYVTFWCSERDNGIYDGMNKGIEHATGEYLYFLNSGDSLYGDVLNKISFDGSGYIYGDVRIVYSEKHIVDRKLPDTIDAVFLLLKDTIYHQAAFIHHSLFQGQKYRTDYLIASDWIHVVENIIMKGCSYSHIPMLIVDYDGNGLSATNFSLGMEERARWIKDNIPPLLYESLLELDKTHSELQELQNSELGKIIPLVGHTRKFAKRARKLICFLYKINCVFSSSHKHKKD